MNEKLPPHDIDAEEAVNGSLLIDGESIYKVDSFLQPADFYHEPNRLIYQACLSIYQRGEAINQISVAQELNREKKLETVGGAAYLSHLIASCPTSLDIESYAQIVYRLSIMRRLIDAGNQITAIGYSSEVDVESNLSRSEEILYRLRHGQSNQDLVHIRQVLDKYFETTTSTPTPGAPLPFVRSGFSKLDEFLGGFQRADLIIVAGRPSMGKTSFALSVARNAAIEQGACVALFSLEMSRDSLVQRLLSSESNVDSRRVPFGKHRENEEKRIMEAQGALAETHIYIDDYPMLRSSQIRSKARRLHFERGIDLIIIDYLQLMQGDGKSENRVQEISYISRSLKALARELNAPVLAVSQLSRAVEFRASHKPQLSDLRESGAIEQDADLVLFIYRDDYYFKTPEEWEVEHAGQDYPKGIANIITAKNRNGPTGEIDLRFTPETAKFEDMSTDREEPSLL